MSISAIKISLHLPTSLGEKAACPREAEQGTV